MVAAADGRYGLGVKAAMLFAKDKNKPILIGGKLFSRHDGIMG